MAHGIEKYLKKRSCGAITHEYSKKQTLFGGTSKKIGKSEYECSTIDLLGKTPSALRMSNHEIT